MLNTSLTLFSSSTSSDGDLGAFSGDGFFLLGVLLDEDSILLLRDEVFEEFSLIEFDVYSRVDLRGVKGLAFDLER